MSRSKQIRVLILLLILTPLVYMATLERDHRPDWNRTLIVGIYPHNADGSREVEEYLKELDINEFREIEDYMAANAAMYNMNSLKPFEIRLGKALKNAPPPPGMDMEYLEALLWAANLRWWHFRLNRQGLKPDIIIVADYHSDDDVILEQTSIGMASPRLGLAQMSIDERFSGYNRVVLAHELLHTVGAEDLYNPSNNLPVFPHGYADPEKNPLYPQHRAELMAGRIPLAPHLARDAGNLSQTVIGRKTAAEIGWLR